MADLSNRLGEILRAYHATGAPKKPVPYSVDGRTAWNLRMTLGSPGEHELTLRNLRVGDERLLRSFRDELSPRSRELFCPYPWDDESRLLKAFETAVVAAEKRVDVSYLMLIAGRPVGHFFLWKAGGNDHSRRHGVEVPELGVALGDGFQGRGLGYLAVEILKAVAEHLGSDAIELTTAPSNDAGWRTYRKAGFAFRGMIQNPLEADVTAVTAGEVRATKFRTERQMAFIINEAKRKEVLAYLAEKRGVS